VRFGLGVYLPPVFHLFAFASERKLDQAPNYFRARGFVILLLGPAFTFGHDFHPGIIKLHRKIPW